MLMKKLDMLRPHVISFGQIDPPALDRGDGKQMGYPVRDGLVYVSRVSSQGKIASIEPFAVAPEGTVFRKNNEPAIRLEKGVKWGFDFMRRKR